MQDTRLQQRCSSRKRKSIPEISSAIHQTGKDVGKKSQLPKLRRAGIISDSDSKCDDSNHPINSEASENLMYSAESSEMSSDEDEA